MSDLTRPRDTHEREYGACAVSAWGRDCRALAPDTSAKFKRQTNSERGGESWKDERGVTVCTEVGKFLASAGAHYQIAVFQPD